jgi:hypothetical protein
MAWKAIARLGENVIQIMKRNYVCKFLGKKNEEDLRCCKKIIIKNCPSRNPS